MNKDEILKKSVKENALWDERDKHLRIHSDAFCNWGVIILGIIIMAIKIHHGKSASDIISIFFCLAATGFLYSAIKTKKLVYIMATILCYALTIYYFYWFYVGVV